MNEMNNDKKTNEEYEKENFDEIINFIKIIDPENKVFIKTNELIQNHNQQNNPKKNNIPNE